MTLPLLGETIGHAIGFSAGVIVMYGGFVRTTRRRVPSPPSPAGARRGEADRGQA